MMLVVLDDQMTINTDPLARALSPLKSRPGRRRRHPESAARINRCPSDSRYMTSAAFILGVAEVDSSSWAPANSTSRKQQAVEASRFQY